jgi:peptidoglycan/LPS O-acetylase OafA/YrhL
VTSPAEPGGPERDRALDGLRGVAVGLVLLLHFQLLGCGWIGVPIFFVLSGFLITRILLGDRAMPLGPYLRRFWFRRSLRIFPLAYAYLVILGGLALLAGETSFSNALSAAAPTLGTYTYNFTRLSDGLHDPLYKHFWSLCVEEQFYLLWPFAVHRLSRRHLGWLLGALIVLCPAFRAGFGHALVADGTDAFTAGDAVYWSFGSHLDAFAMGAAIAVFDLPKRVKRPGRWALLATILLAAAAGLNLHALLAGTSDAGATISTLGLPLSGVSHGQHVWSYTLIDLWAAAVILWLLTGAPAGRALAVWPLARIGRVSYGVYILHMLVLSLFIAASGVDPLDSPHPGWFVVWALLVWLAAEVSWWTLERPVLRFRDRREQ